MQSNLFDVQAFTRPVVRQPDVTRGRHGGNAASVEADERVAPHKEALRGIILNYLELHPMRTCKEVAKATRIGYTTVSGRISELKRARLIEGTGKMRDGAEILRRTTAGKQT